MLFIKNSERNKFFTFQQLESRKIMNKEIIITFSYYGIGGAQRRAFTLANSFAQNGYTVYVIAVLGSDSTINEKNYYNIDEKINLVLIPEYFEIHKNDKNIKKIISETEKKIRLLKRLQFFSKICKKTTNKINYHINGLRKSISLKSFLISHPNATVINFGFNIFDYTYFAAKNTNQKIIYAETNASDKYSSDRFFGFTKNSIKKSDAFIFQTTEEKAEHNLLKNKKAFVIHNPIKPGLPSSADSSRNKTIVNFCRLSRQKNLMLLINAFEKFAVDYPDYCLKLYADTLNSDNIDYKKELTDYIAEKKLENSVLILPPSENIHQIILDSAMFVSSSDYEGISNSMIEAMAIGLPCVCTDCGGGGAREMITDGENGLLVPVRDAEALKNAMIRMITEEGLAEKCSKNASKIKETHSIEKISRKWLEVINNV